MEDNSMETFKLTTKFYAKLKIGHYMFIKIIKISLLNMRTKWMNAITTEVVEVKNVDYKLISEIENSIIEIETARNIFENVDEGRLVESAIYLEVAALKRLDYLISIAKGNRITVSSEYIARKYLEFLK
ncbi:DUF2508 family protein [Clostridium sp. SHJSY1]|uniref:DUF2508 family protein n=1 Tax=Clostridium sp. SHJSY1 TaxID=2942483 RepID=UPI002875D42C|nr:DUF2508 family protein [Clostridium sp. SHJSY1]MDS0525282.1 DUF2508 family protein [Clostridium sp. SHJSY1]